MKTPSTVYKVVIEEGSIFRSSDAPDSYALYYSVGAVTTPFIGQIFCFETLKDAKRYASYLNGIHILECKPIGKVVRPKTIAGTLGGFQEFWKAKKSKKRPTVITDAPPVGAILCDKIEVLREIPKDEENWQVPPPVGHKTSHSRKHLTPVKNNI